MIRQWTCVLWIAGVACTSVKTDDTAAGGAVVDPTDDTGTSVVDTGCDDPVDLYYDADGDGYGDDALMVSTCDSPAGHVTQGGDCDDIASSAQLVARLWEGKGGGGVAAALLDKVP